MAVKLILFLALLTQVSCKKHSVTFVIDDTYSLIDDIKQVKNATKLIIDLEKASDIEDYVLVTFNDSDIDLKKKTQNPKELIEALDSIKVHNGSKAVCPEITLSGLKRALNESREGSHFYVFTDASARDYDKFEEVKALCQEKKSQIYFIVSGHCGDMTTRKYQVYHKLAFACKGQAITVDKDDVTQVPEYLKKIIEGDRTVIESVVIPANRWDNTSIKFSIDVLTENTIISASGIDIDLEIANARNYRIKRVNKTWTQNFKVFEPSNRLRDGIYTVKVRGKSPVEVTVMARRNFTFEYGFSMDNVTSMNETDPQPFTDIKTRLTIFAKDPEGSAEVKEVELHDVTKKVSLALTPVADNVYATEEFVSPEQPFRIAVVVIAKKAKKPVKSFAKTLVTPIQPGPVEHIKVKEGASVDIHCRTPSNKTKAQISWYEKTTKESNFSVLDRQTKEVLHVDKPVDKIYYKCLARDATGTEQYNGQLDIQVRPEFIYPPAVLPTNINDPATIECKIFKGNPRPEITWEFKRVDATEYEQIINQNDTFNVPSAQLENSGDYRCFANNTAGSDEKITKLVVQVVPEVLKSNDEFTVKEGSSIDVECSILNGTPKPEITWYTKQQDATEFEEIVDEKDETLHVTRAKISKIYKCEAKNSAGIDFNTVTINVEARPEFKFTTPNVTVTEGDPATINCKLRKGSPPLKRSWEKKLKGMTSFSTMRHEGEDLNITAANLSHAGEYKCVAKNTEGSVEKVTELIVHAVPSIEDVASNITALENSNVILQCRITKGFPKPTVNWFYKDPELPEFVNMSKTGETLQLENVQVSFSGRYKCVAENEIGQAEQIVQLVVNAPPKIIFVPPNTAKHTAVEGDPAMRLPCAAVGHPTPAITWLVDNKIVGLDKCLLPKETGPCLAGHTKWYFDKALKECRRFTYGGCRGNDNRFDSEEECRSECASRAGPVAPTPDKCQLPMTVGPCQAAFPKWYFDNTLKQCHQFTYGGCNGNANKFDSEMECLGECIPPPPIGKCQQPVDAGPCRASFRKWYFDNTLKQCLQFSYGGCRGNANRFDSETACKGECALETEPKGKFAQIHIEDNVLIIPNPKEADSSGYHTYICRATNEVGQDSQTYEVVITDHIELSKVNEILYATYKKPYDIECLLSYSDPSSIKWYKNSKLIPEKTGPLFHFDDPTEHDSGNYTCRVSGLTDSASHTLQVNFGLRPMRNQTLYNVEWNGDEKYLNCYSFEYPDGKYEWFYNGKQIDWNNEHIKVADWGEYICKVTNPLGSLDITFKVTTPECRVPKSVFTAERAPLVLDSSLSWPILRTVHEHFIVPRSEKLQLICQDDSNSPKKNSFTKFPNVKSLYATCDEEDLFMVDGNKRAISEFECEHNVMPGAKQTKIQCLGNETELIQVGFTVNVFTEVYQSCMDLIKLVPLYTKMNTIPVQREFVSDASTEETCEDESKCCYELIQLVNGIDVSFGPAKSGTSMHSLNSVNYCKLKNDFDWYDIEMTLRSEIPYTVWTGAANYMEVDIKGETKNVPRYLWKVLKYYSGSDEETVAVIHENVDNPGPKLCAGACGYKTTLFEPSGDRTYCCSLEDFKKALGVVAIDFNL